MSIVVILLDTDGAMPFGFASNPYEGLKQIGLDLMA